MAATISFQKEDATFTLKEKTKHKAWLNANAKKEDYVLLELTYLFCSDDYLHTINLTYLNHDTLTDIITFDNSEAPKEGGIEGDIFISIDRVKENAKTYEVTFQEELRRVMAHGLLHLMGYKDKSPKAKQEMRAKEDACLLLFNRIK